MGLDTKAVNEQLANTTKGAEALVVKLKELHLRIEMLRNTRQVSSDTAGLLDSLVTSAYVNAANLKTYLDPISASPTPEEEGQEGKPSDKQVERLSCHRCGREIRDGYKLCPYSVSTSNRGLATAVAKRCLPNSGSARRAGSVSGNAILVS